MKTNQKIVSAEFYIEKNEYNMPTLILEVLENGMLKRNKCEFQRYRKFPKSILNHYIAIIYFSNNLFIGITESDSHVSLHYNHEDHTSKTLLATLEKTDDDRFLYGKALKEYKERVKTKDKKKGAHYASELIMNSLNIRVYKLNVNKNK